MSRSFRGSQDARRAPLTEREKLAREAAARQVERTLRFSQAGERAGVNPPLRHESEHAAAEDRFDRSAQAAPVPAAPVDSAAAAPGTGIDPAEAPEVELADPSPFSEPASLDLRGGMPPPLRGSLALLERQDERLQADGLERIENERDLSLRIAHHLLVPLPVSSALTVNAQLTPRHRYCRPWTALFLSDLARAHEAEFHRPLEISSAVRTVAYQERLMRINGNAAPAYGQVFSPHLMGASIDIAKKPMSLDEIAWMRRHLLALELAGKIDVEEEFEQACFHITVYKSYAPERLTRPAAPRRRASRTTASAVAGPSGQ